MELWKLAHAVMEKRLDRQEPMNKIITDKTDWVTKNNLCLDHICVNFYNLRDSILFNCFSFGAIGYIGYSMSFVVKSIQ